MIFSQPDSPQKIILKTGGQFGFIMQHRNTMGHLVNSHIYGINLDLGFSTHGSSIWHFENNFPERGFSMQFVNLGNPQQLGYLFSMAPYYDIPLKEKESRSRLYMRMAFGAAYLTQKFDPIYNHKNNVMSVALNGFVNFKWFYKIKIAANQNLEVGLNFAHASNAKFKAPNLGINMLTLQTVYSFSKPKKNQIKSQLTDTSTKAKSKNEICVLANFGINEIEPPGGKKYLAQVYDISFFRNLRNTHKFGAGFEILQLGANKDLLWNEDSVQLKGTFAYTSFAAKFSYGYAIGRAVFPFEMGAYLRNPYKTDGTFYHRIGLRYFFKNNMIAAITLRTHWAVANHFEVGWGYRFPIRKP